MYTGSVYVNAHYVWTHVAHTQHSCKDAFGVRVPTYVAYVLIRVYICAVCPHPFFVLSAFKILPFLDAERH
jgi:hypothetical protein